ncbi:FAD-binding domain-containing protein [Coniochaeta ligniaria NRRL 30616]|uniref:FAD-binding domain-containing protein n=1 Tax=Coniochaeta ligniaria NRRL 30616 TaxID=1408157 RepID=A0A1J7IU53_9PEZI|nr:FAD-binding domain-containing protein [Coniochaeta ligniaria NRRL 30616]
MSHIMLLIVSIHIFIASAFLQIPLASSHPSSPLPSCKAVPGTPNWPSPASWARLNESTGGRLLQPPPPGAVCHPGQPTYDAAACADVQAGWTTYDFHQRDPVSSMWNQYNNDSCLPEPGYPCSGQGYPVFVINATTPEHVKLGVRFARNHNVRLVVKSTGHDYVGRSVAPNALSIWTHHLKGIKTHTSFKPKCCNVHINSTAVTVGAGEQMIDLYTHLDALNQTIVGGGGETVSVGGYLTGGGHSLLSARYGLGADQVLELQAVTPTGNLIVANECQNTDLFWAMRGGGGSTFGVVTSVTMRTYPTPQLTNLFLTLATTNSSSPRVWDMVAYVLSQFPSLGDAGLSGYSYLFNTIPNPLGGGASGTVSGMIASVVLQDTQDAQAMTALWAPVLAHVSQTWPEMIVDTNITAFPSFLAWYREHHDTTATGNDTFVGSRLLDEAALTGNLTASADAFRRLSSGGVATAYLVSGKGVRDARPRGGGDAVLPAWRRAYVHSTVGVDFHPLNATARAEAMAKLNYSLEPLRKLAPDMGAYMNEANPYEPDWQHQFWGANYERLVQIKRAVDPEDVLWCAPCVGNERWREIGNRLCRV